MSNFLTPNNYFPYINDPDATSLENNSFESNYYNRIFLDKEEIEKELLYQKDSKPNFKTKQNSLIIDKNKEVPIKNKKNKIRFKIRRYNDKFFYNLQKQEKKNELKKKTTLDIQKDKKSDGNPPFFHFLKLFNY